MALLVLQAQLAQAGAATVALQGAMATAEAAHREQVDSLRHQLADMGSVSLDLRAGIAAADAARNLQVSWEVQQR